MAGVRGVEVYTRLTMYSVALVEPFFFLLTGGALVLDEPPPLGLVIAVVVLAVAHTVLCLLTVHAGLGRHPFATRRERAVLAALLVISAALVLTALLGLPTVPADGPQTADGEVVWSPDDPRSILIGTVAAFTLSALSPVLSMGRLAVAVGAMAAVVVVGRAVSAPGSGLVGLGAAAFFLVLFLVSSFRLTVWILFVVRELDASRDVAARLAVAEERLRISRDMHDVVGRALSAVAVKSELAAALTRRGDARAADEMLEVNALAQESLREVRGVVAGYRSADLGTELAGARAVLRAAGIAARVVGDVPTLGAPQAEAVAWVVREAVTNVVRHSDASECVLRLTADDGRVVLRVTNDGVRQATAAPEAAPGGGSGIQGLRERLAAVGGTLLTDHAGDRFTLTASLPTPGVPLGARAADGAAVGQDPYALRTAGEDA